MGLLVISGLVVLLLGLIRLGSRIRPKNLGPDEHFRRGAELPLFPFGKQPTEPVDAERARTGRPF